MNNSPLFSQSGDPAPVETSAVDDRSLQTSDGETFANEKNDGSEHFNGSPNKIRSPFLQTAFEFLELFAFSVFAVMLLFTFCFRLCRVEGSSMENTLASGESLLISGIGYTPKQDDIIVFHLTDHDNHMEKNMVKRIIATGGQELTIDFNTGIITVDGVEYEDSHRTLKDLNNRKVSYYSLFANHYYDRSTGIFHATVPEGTVFVMGDNRNNSKDSRNMEIGFVDERCILGKVLFRLSPFTVLG